jgi:DTW domain-containing protein YfiP
MKALINSEMRIRGLESGAVDLSDLISDEYETFVLFPAENSTLLTEEFVKGIKKKIQLIVPDGNWRQASKVCTRQKELSQIKRVMVSRSSKDPYHMRAESSENGMATLQSIAHALGIIEGDEVKKQLLKLYNEKLVRTLVGRGQLSPKELELN